MSARPDAAALAAALAALSSLLGQRLVTGQAIRDQHGKDVTHHPGQSPDAVAFVTTRDEVQAVLRICHAQGVPVIPFGAGSSLEGHIAAPFGGVTLNVAGMDRILSLNAADMDVTVEPGVTREALNTHLRDTGLFSPSTPAPMPASAAWRRPAPPAPMPCGTAPWPRMSVRSRWCCPTAR